MPEYTNQNCPVCNKPFEENDDIVVCPECGTPHHRECYKLAGHCVNYGLHKSGYDYYQEIKKETQNKPSENTKFDNNISFLSSNEEDKVNSKTNSNSNTPEQPIFSANAFEFKNPYENSEGTINDHKISDIAATVRINIPRFINKFKQMETTNKKRSWNWSAFIFGAYYYLYRKMYKQGILYLLITTALSFATTFLIQQFAPETYQTILNFVTEFSANPSSVSSEMISAMTSASDYQNAYLVSIGISGITLIVRIIAAIFADSFYKKNIENIITTVDKKIEEGASFIQNPMFSTIDTPNEKQIRLMYLSKKGGTNLLIPLLAYWIVNFVTTYL